MALLKYLIYIVIGASDYDENGVVIAGSDTARWIAALQAQYAADRRNESRFTCATAYNWSTI